ncbi:MAG: Mut7-C RNAse domain-containing protein [Candidatus Eisenbacteria bacterium]|nr:Mut7-C RNAse domain-containing protein [Candidatus Eisenbacteria bacterium]
MSPRAQEANRTPKVKFLVDSTVARLSHWLRFLGYDAALDNNPGDAALLARARREGRVLLTRKRSLGTSSGFTTAVVRPAGGDASETGSASVAAAGSALLLSSDFVSDQLRQVASGLGLTLASPPRCTVCNSELCLVSRAEADGRVPEFVYRTRSDFAFCPQCDRYYWKGTHWDHAGLKASAALSGRRQRRDT